ncbi:hypothetical protein AB8S08_11535 [Pseudidiomarina sp. PP-1MA]|uniref:Uncharacterized protein n=1 Tax=Pseudidiomarina sp. PP-1MA TaxID=3237706 RepID=A0AB39X5N8_9GAMM
MSINLITFNFQKDYKPLSEQYFNGESLGILLFEAHKGVEISHRHLLDFYCTKTKSGIVAPISVQQYVASLLQAIVKQEVPARAIIQGLCYKGRMKSESVIDTEELHLILRKNSSAVGETDKKATFERVSTDFPELSGYRSAAALDQLNRKERARIRRHKEVKVMLDSLSEDPQIPYEQARLIFDRLKNIYVDPSRLY